MKTNNICSFRIILLSVFFLKLTDLTATNYYVDPSSTVNIANGTITNPWKTIAQVNSGTVNIAPGDTVFFKRSQVYNGRLVVGGSGTSTRPIVYTSYGMGDMPEFTYTGYGVIVMYNRQYIVIDRLKITDPTMNISDHTIQAKISYGIVIGNSPNCTISNCDISLVGMGISTEEGSDFCNLTGNYIHNLRAVKNTPTSINANDDYGATAIVLSSSNNIISNSRFEDCWCTSYDYGYDGGIVELFGTNISNNKVVNNIANNSNGFMEVGSATNGIATNNLVAYNKVINCGLTCCFHNKNTDGFYIRTDNFQFYNNTIVETKRQFEVANQMFWYADPYAVNQVVLKNNIIWLTTGENIEVNPYLYPDRVIHTNNIYKIKAGAQGPILDPSEYLTYGPLNIFVDTTVADPINWDFRLLPGSLPVDFGVDLGFTTDLRGNPIIGKPDAGANELIPLNGIAVKKIYVDPSSQELIADGTITNPWKTIDQVNSATTALLPGDTVFFMRNQLYTGRLLIRASGTADRPIVFMPYGLGKIPEFTNTTSDVIVISNQQHVILNRLKITDRTMSISDHSVQAKISYGIVLVNSPNCTISNCEISLVGVGIAVRSGSDSAKIRGNNIFNLRAIRNTIGGTDDYGANAIVIGSSNNLINNNRFADCWATSNDFGFLGGAIEMFNTAINNNQLLYNTATNCNGFVEIGGNTSGNAINNLIAYNKILNCGQTATLHNKVGQSSYINTNNTRIFNNIIIETKIQFNRASAMFWYADPTKIDVVIMRNNIIWLTTGENVVNDNLDTAKLVHTNNIYKLTGGRLGVNPGLTELVLVGDAPIFVDTTGDQETWDYRLLPGSPAIDFGADVGLVRDIIGTAVLGKPDAGIYEYIPVIIPKAPSKYYADPSSTSLIADGSYINPWKTIAQINAGTTMLVPGDTVFFRRGQSFAGRLSVQRSGSQANPIVYTSYGVGAKPELTNTTTDVILISNQDYIVIDGFKITDKTMDTSNHAVIARIAYAIVLEASPYCTIRNCDISLVGVGIASREGSDFTTITNNNIYNLRAVKNTTASISSSDDYGANGMVLGSSNNVVTYNSFRDCYAPSYDYVYVGSIITLFNTNVSNNRILYNTAINSLVFLEIGSIHNGVAINNLVAYNKIINCGQTTIFHNNPGFEKYVSTNNTRFFNNVIIETKPQFIPGSSLFWYDDPATLDIAVVRNNIFWLTNGARVYSQTVDSSRIEHSNNIYKITNGIIGDLTVITDTLITGISSIFVDTTGDPGRWNYHLTSVSPAINFGTDVSIARDFEGNAIIDKTDAGVYEYQLSIPPPPPLTILAKADSIKCYGQSASVTISASGGVPPYSGIGVYTVAAGNYMYIVADATGTKDTIDVTLTQPGMLNLNLTVAPYPANSDTTRIYAVASGGTIPYLYQLNNGIFQTAGTFYNIYAGNYTVTVKDFNLCTLTNAVVVPINSIQRKDFIIDVYPNPTSTYFILTINNYQGLSGNIKVKVFNSNGNLVYTARGSSYSYYSFGANFNKGVYTLVVELGGTAKSLQVIKL